MASNPKGRYLGSDEDLTLATARHSCAHLMAAAIQDIWPDTKFGVGPATENGFYYDVLAPESIRDVDLAQIESRMQEIKKRNVPITRVELGIDQAVDEMRRLDQNFKLELLALLKEKGSTAVEKETGDSNVAPSQGGVDHVSFYVLDDFTDLCRGPHVPGTGAIGAFKLTNIAGAYWRGNEKNQQFQRIYGLCFKTQEDLDAELWRIEQRKLRDHRKLGKELELFTFSHEVGLGLPLWLPNGTVLRMELERLARETEKKYGYVQVRTPQLALSKLYHQSGHLPYYAADMYPAMKVDDSEEFYLRPMNCPHHHHVYLARKRSYRELPVRIAEYGDVFRYEAHGTLSGLMRTRSFCQNDAHIYCRFDQAKDEFVRVMRLHAEYYDLFSIKDYYMRLSLPDLQRLEKYVNEPEKWLAALSIVKEAMIETGYPFVEAEGEAAFYGPKVDFMIRSVVGTEYAISTNQLDFLATSRFDLTYQAQDDQQHPVYVIHRAPLGSHERFTAFLIEHYAGAFPTWLAPVQVVVVPVSERHLEYANRIANELSAAPVKTATDGLRVKVDDSGERMQKKIRNAQIAKVPYILVLGDREVENGTASVRLRTGTDLGAKTIAEVLARLTTEVGSRQDQPDA